MSFLVTLILAFVILNAFDSLSYFGGGKVGLKGILKLLFGDVDGYV